MVNSLENIDKSKVSATRIEGLDEVVSGVIGDTLTGAVSTITTSDLTAGKILVSDNNGKVAASDKGINDISGINNKITNCITEIPQDIKLELNNGTLTLKAGSKVYVPNGAGNFNVRNITTDVSATTTSNGVVLYGLHPNGNLARFNQTFSGSSQPESKDLYAWYDTTNNIIKRYSSVTSSWEGGFSLPIAKVTVSNGVISSIDQVFNGFGYIGSTVFALPGVKGLIPNGRNDDGSLKNIDVSLTSVCTVSYASTNDLYFGIVGGNRLYYQSKSAISYDESTNTTNWKTAIIAEAKVTSGVISDFKPKTTFHAVDYNDFSDLKDTVDINDSNVVHKTGNETINGNKTFTSNVRVSKTAPYVDLYNTNITKGIVPSSLQAARNAMVDKDGKNIAMTQYQYNTAGETQAVIRAYNPNNETDFAQISIWYPPTGNPYTYAPHPATAQDSSNKIATTAWVNNLENSVVHKTGDETITGFKTFTNSVITNHIFPKGDITLGTSTNTWGKMIQFQDTTGKRIARVQPMAVNTTNNRVGMWVNNADNTVENGIFIDSDGAAYAPTPNVSSNGTYIATTAYVNTKFQVVSTLPASPNSNVFYFIPE